MSRRYTGAALLLALGIAEQFFPGWNGMFAEAAELSTDGQRVVMSIFFTGAIIMFFGTSN
jgi:hypothetical protein